MQMHDPVGSTKPQQQSTCLDTTPCKYKKKSCIRKWSWKRFPIVKSLWIMHLAWRAIVRVKWLTELHPSHPSRTFPHVQYELAVEHFSPESTTTTKSRRIIWTTQTNGIKWRAVAVMAVCVWKTERVHCYTISSIKASLCWSPQGLSLSSRGSVSFYHSFVFRLFLFLTLSHSSAVITHHIDPPGRDEFTRNPDGTLGVQWELIQVFSR